MYSLNKTEMEVIIIEKKTFEKIGSDALALDWARWSIFRRRLPSTTLVLKNRNKRWRRCSLSWRRSGRRRTNSKGLNPNSQPWTGRYSWIWLRPHLILPSRRRQKRRPSRTRMNIRTTRRGRLTDRRSKCLGFYQSD